MTSHVSDLLLYFAYGSNMRTSRMRRRVPAVGRGRVAHLTGYRRTFDKPGTYGGKTNIRSSANQRDVVPGVVFALTAGQLDELATHEPGYKRERVRVALADGTLADAWTFIAEETAEGLKPTRRYLDHLIAGGREYGFTDDEMRAIEATEVDG